MTDQTARDIIAKTLVTEQQYPTGPHAIDLKDADAVLPRPCPP